MQAILGDVRLAFRRLRQAPALALVSLLTLALGTGAVVALFTLFNAIVLRPLPVPAADRLVAIEVRGSSSGTMTQRTFHALAREQQVFAAIAGALPGGLVPARVDGSVMQSVIDAVTVDFFRVLGLDPAAGRLLGAGDFAGSGESAAPVCVVSYGFWQRAFAGRADAVGAAIEAGETTCTVVGVTPPSFVGVQVGVATDIYIPLPLAAAVLGVPANAVPVSRVLARLDAPHAAAESREGLNATWAAVLEETVPATLTPDRRDEWFRRRLEISPAAAADSFWRQRYGRPLLILAGAAAWLLIIACANLAGLQMAHAARQRTELLLRTALGASRWQVIRPLLVERVLLSAAGLALGAPLAWWGVDAVVALMSTTPTPLALDLEPDANVWTAVSALSALVVLVAGVVPSWLATRQRTLHVASSRLTSSGWRVAALVTQVSLSAVLLAGAGVATGTLLDIRLRDHGFDARHVAVAQLTNQPGAYTGLDEASYYPELVRRLEALPGIGAVALAKPTPGLSSQWLRPLARLDGRGPADLSAEIVVVSPNYFTALGIPLLRGRDVAWSDNASAPPVAIVSRRVARQLFPDEEAIGRRIRVGTERHHQALEIVGIVADASVLNVRVADPPIVYVAFSQQPPPYARWPAVLARTEMPPAQMEATFRQAVDALGREFVARYRALDTQVAQSLAGERLVSWLSLAYAVVALTIVGVGLLALLLHDATSRTREYGVRMALGASPQRLRNRIVLRGLSLSAVGVLVAAPGSFAVTRLLESVVGPQTPTAVLFAVVASATLLVVGASAAVVPARRVATVDPAVALRAE